MSLLSIYTCHKRTHGAWSLIDLARASEIKAKTFTFITSAKGGGGGSHACLSGYQTTQNLVMDVWNYFLKMLIMGKGMAK